MSRATLACLAALVLGACAPSRTASAPQADRVTCDVARAEGGTVVRVETDFPSVQAATARVVALNRARPSLASPMVFAACSVETAAASDYVYPGLRVHGSGE